MTKPSKKDVDAVAALVENAEAGAALEQVRGKLERLTGTDFPAVAALLGLLVTSHAVEADMTLLGAVDAIQGVFVRLWTDVEEVLE